MADRSWKLGLYIVKDLFKRGTTTSHTDRAGFEVTLYPVILGEHPDYYSHGDGPETVRNVSERYRFLHGMTLHNFEVFAWGKEAHDGTRELWHYGWAFKPYRVDIDNAMVLSKSVGIIERRLRAMDEQEGRPADFPAFMERIARAIKADVVVLDRGPNTTGKWGYEGVEHSIVPVGEGINQLRWRIEQWVAETAPAPKAVAG